jgi:NADPH-dependent 2,4-dienoyl-CoA reductase/sulfur reductase-like enzyme/rhodanese-related sulfurtransferase
MPSEIVVIGGVAAGPKAAARARRRDPEAKITILEKGEFLSYAGCGLPFYIAGQVQEARDLWCTPVGVARDAVFFKTVKDIEVRTRTFVTAIDRRQKEVLALNVDSGEQTRLHYDKLVLATGSQPIVPSIPGLDLNRVFHLSNPSDAIALRTTASLEEVRRVTIVGAGLIGLEVTGALASLGLEVTIIDKRPQPLSTILDPEIGALLANHLRSKKIDVRLGESVLRFEGDATGNVHKVVTENDEIETDMVLVAIGVRPNVVLAKEAGLLLGSTGAIAVDEHLQTSDPDIYAGGDCVENTHLVTGQRVYAAMGSIANKHGRVIGDNVTGGREVLDGIVGTAVLEVMGFNVGRTGLSETEALGHGYEVVTAVVPSSDCAHYHPAHKSMTMKLVVDAKSRKVLGAQGVGPGDLVKRIDVVATALTFGAGVDRLAQIDLGYAPPSSTAIDIIEHAANVVRNKLDGLAVGIPASELKAKLEGDDDFLLLDVRTPKEYQTVRIPDPRLKLVPLGKLRQELANLPKEREIVTYCQASLRGYEAQTILAGAGFRDVKFVDGGIAAWPYKKDTEPPDKE